MKFSELIDGAEVLAVSGDAEVTGVQYDSRKIHTGDCFVAMRGERTDGNQFIGLALAAGATAVITDSPGHEPSEGVAWAHVPHGRRGLARVSANFYGRPAEKTAIVGVTGTNGKTTTTFLIDSILASAKRSSALIGTIEYRIAGSVIPAPHTTPEALELHKFLSQAVVAGVRDAVMEVSSHALAQERIYGVPFDVAVFTNLTQDHLDYHGGMEDYFAAKEKLFSGVGTLPPRAAVVNNDDQCGRRIARGATANGSQVFTYGLERGDFSALRRNITATGTRLDISTPQGEIDLFTPLVGAVNVYNVLAASAAASARGCTLDQIHRGVLALAHVPGRFQRVDMGQPFTVAVDYAHTEDALRNLTRVAREFASGIGKQGRVLTVFGCGGDRDRRKRPLMGEAAGAGSDFVVLTSDNPRSEDPLGIIHDALHGLRKSGVDFTIEPDRERAIHLVIQLARPGDILLIAGKGHEKYQVLADRTIPFDDVEVSRRALVAAGFTNETSKDMKTEEIAGGSR